MLLLGCCAARADISVDARLSRNATTLSEPVQLQIKIVGAERIGEHPDVTADGLAIRYIGPMKSSMTQFENGIKRSENTVIFLYDVRGEQHGTFTIPSLRISADGQKFTTQPVALTIQQKPPTAEDSTQKPVLSAEFEVKKKTLYVGETVPAELRLYVDTRVSGHVSDMPSITAEGLTTQNMPSPHQENAVTREGRECNLVIFETAITPSKAGKITLGPAEIPFEAQMPQDRRRGASFLDSLRQSLGNDPFFSPVQQLKITAPPVALTVKPLPVAGRPVDFSGAVGSFDLAAEGTPKRVNVGDPLTMKIAVSGVGNFDRVTVPVIKDLTGWRTYPPSSTFASDLDLSMKGKDIGIRGTKTFEMAVIPETIKREMPIFEFSYFDPASGKYVTKTSQPAALLVEGPANAPAPATNAGAVSALPAAIEKKPAPPTDILGLRYDSAAARQSFEPLYMQRQFLLAQGAPLIALIAFLGWRLRPSPNERAHRTTSLRRERSALMAKLNDKNLDHSEFFDHAARVLQIDTALATGKEAASVDAPAARASASVDDSTADVIEEVFKARAELLYAGGNGDGGAVPNAQRDRILAAINRFGKSHGKQ